MCYHGHNTRLLLHITNEILTRHKNSTLWHNSTRLITREESHLYMKGGLKNKLQQAFRNRNHLFTVKFSWLMIRNIQNQIQIKHIYMYNNKLEQLVFIHHFLKFIYPVTGTILFKIPAVRRVMWGLQEIMVQMEIWDTVPREGKTGETHVSSSSERGSSLLKSVIVSSCPSTLSIGSGLKEPVEKIIWLWTGTIC